MKDEKMVTVCDKCQRAACWQGLFYCDDYVSAGTVDLPVSRLRELDLEHPDYWEDEDAPAQPAQEGN
jgi:hypothetical protein